MVGMAMLAALAAVSAWRAWRGAPAGATGNATAQVRAAHW